MRNTRSKATKQNKFLKFVTIPIRALCKARDSYVKGMTSYANRMHYGNINAMGVQRVEQAHGLPKSYSVNPARSNNSDEYRELIRFASARNVGPYDLDTYIGRQMTMRSGSVSRPQPQPQQQPKNMPRRSRSVALVRIDEDRPCCFFGSQDSISNIANKTIIRATNDFKLSRSSSHYVAR